MSDPTPPPDEPMPEQSRARIRAELLEAAQTPAAPRRWLIPGAVAAAVVLVAGLAAWTVGAGGDAAPDDAAPPAAATSRSPVPPPLPPPTQTPVDPLPDLPSPTGVHQAGKGDCPQEMESVLPGAQQAASFGDGTTFYVRGDRFALCDVRSGVTTVHHALPLEPAKGVESYRVSSAYTPDGQVTRVAGGIVPDGALAFDVTYTFPDGETLPAETVQGGGHTWWRVVHSYRSRGNEMQDPPIEVTVSYSGVQEHYELD